MSQNFSEIKKAIDGDLQQFNSYYRETLRSDRKIMDDIVDYLMQLQGKQIRPLLVILSCGMHGEITQKAYTAATVIELTHMASLIHDDVVDEAYMRRSKWSFNALWRSRKAVLIGDYVFSKAFREAARSKMYGVIDDIADVIESMSVGELYQSDAAMKLDITEEDYYEVIRCKTATLMGSCMYTGALAAGAEEEECEKIRKIGTELGIVFQIKDDILDYSPDKKTGKTAGNDIKERKITLPLICALEKATKKERKEVISVIEKISRNPEGADIICKFVKDKDGIALAEEKMMHRRRKIEESLMNYRESKYRDTMITLTRYICEREE